LHRAEELPKEEFKREVERHLTGNEPSLGSYSTSRLQEPAAVIEQALKQLSDAGN